jgi:ACR3 family arsenite efflux pump ArsB
VLIAIPLLIQTYGIFAIAYGAARAPEAAPQYRRAGLP